MQPEPAAGAPPRGLTADGIREAIARRIGDRNYDHWFRDKTTLNVIDDQLTIGVGSPFLMNWMQKQFRPALQAAAVESLGPSGNIRFVVDPQVAFPVPSAVAAETAPATTLATVSDAVTDDVPQTVAADHSNSSRQPASHNHNAVAVSGNPFESIRIRANHSRQAATAETTPPATAGKPTAQSPAQSAASSNPRTGSAPSAALRNDPRTRRRFADLNDFVSGPCNELAMVAATQLCESPGARINPLFVHGGVGVGKTHLVEGIYRRLRRMHPTLNILFLTAEAFANYFTEALREKSLPAFRQRFRGVDVLLVDDVDFLDGKRGIQEEFLHTFKQLESFGRQVVLTSDRHPRLLSRLSDELTTRFVSGLVCRLESPDQETRRRIAEHKLSRLNCDIHPEAINYVSQRFRNNVRELEGALNCLDTWHHMTGRRVTAAVARRILSELERDCVRIIRVADVEQAVCGFFGLEPEDLRSKRRSRSVSHPRMLAMFLSRKLTNAAYSEIGQHYGGRNHSTVMSAEKKVQSWLTDGTPIKIASEAWPLPELLETLEQQLHAS